MDATRIDKWLWAVRLYKTRSSAADACAKNKVTINEQTAKASKGIATGDHIRIKKQGCFQTVKVEKIIEARVGYQMAIDCYTDITSAEDLAKNEQRQAAARKGEQREKGKGRPTKKERRDMNQWKNPNTGKR